MAAWADMDAGRREAAASGRGLRVVVVDEGAPYPLDSGKRLRTWHLLTRLAARHRITLVCPAAHDAGEQRAAEQALAAAGIACRWLAPRRERRGGRLAAALVRNCGSRWPYSVAKHHRPPLRRMLQALSGQDCDLLQIEWTPYASHLGTVAPPCVIASHNIETRIWQRRAEASRNGGARWYFRMQAARMRRFERGVFAAASEVTCVSAEECLTARVWGARRTRVVANGVDVAQFCPWPEDEVKPDGMVFVGALDWFANEDAVRFFVESILPGIRAVRPRACVRIVGRRPRPQLVRRLRAAAGVTLVGEVGDVRPELARAALVVVPLRIGGGSRIKILEALAMAKPVLATPIGAEGLGVEADRQLEIAAGAPAFALRAVELLGDGAQRRRLGEEGCAWVRRHHDWEQCARALEAAWWAAVRPEAELRIVAGGRA